MKVSNTTLPEVLIIDPVVHGDDRGFFFESWNERVFEEQGINARFVQDNHSRSGRSVLRGLHYQLRNTQGKLVRCIWGEVFDVAVDMRRSSPRFGKWAGVRLSGDNKRMLWVPEGFAHGYLVLSEAAEVLYKTTDFYTPAHERAVLWNDPAIGIDWPEIGRPLLSERDAKAPPLAQAETFA